MKDYKALETVCGRNHENEAGGVERKEDQMKDKTWKLCGGRH